MLKQFCLTAGHVEQWSDAAQNVLATAHLQLDVLYMGLEDEAAATFHRHATLCRHGRTSQDLRIAVSKYACRETCSRIHLMPLPWPIQVGNEAGCGGHTS